MKFIYYEILKKFHYLISSINFVYNFFNFIVLLLYSKLYYSKMII